MSTLHKKEYLGDAVYAEANDFHGITLTTENGLHATNTIVLEPEVVVAMLEWMTRAFPNAKDVMRRIGRE